MTNQHASAKPQALRLFKLLPLFILAASVVVAYLLIKNPPQAKKKANPRPQQWVEVMTLTARDEQVTVQSFGTITPQTQGSVVAQVSGTIVQLGAHFRPGDFFSKGDLLLKIDDRDYRFAVEIAQASLTDAKLNLQQEQARVVQAKRDWQRLGKGGKPSELVLRKPQLASAQASIQSAKANLNKALLDLERTQFKAPYDGQILDKKVDIGQFISAGTQLADIFATAAMEVRLPLSSHQQSLIHLPEYDPNAQQPDTAASVTFTGQLGRSTQTWQGRLIRTEAALDSATRQLYVVAQLDNPISAASPQQPPLKIGQFVQAEIDGITLKQVFTVPSANLYPGNQVLLFADGMIERRHVSVAWAGPEYALIDAGLNEGEQLITTPLANAVSGTPAALINNTKVTPLSPMPAAAAPATVSAPAAVQEQ